MLFVHNETLASVWLIDFAKTIPLPENVKIGHRHPWVEGTHEDGYLLGLDNLIEIMQSICESSTDNSISSDSLSESKKEVKTSSDVNPSTKKLNVSCTNVEQSENTKLPEILDTKQKDSSGSIQKDEN